VEWHSEHWIPTELSLPSVLKMPFTPMTAFIFSKATVVAGSSGLTLPAFSKSTTSGDTAAVSTFNASESAIRCSAPENHPNQMKMSHHAQESSDRVQRDKI
jgi:hypothetical protein